MLKTLLIELLKKTKLYTHILLKRKKILPLKEIEKFLYEAPPLLIREKLVKKPLIGIVKSESRGLVCDYENHKAYYLKYERFCKVNNLAYEFYDIEKSTWLDDAKKFDIIIFRTPSNPYSKSMAEEKIYILDKILKKTCFPSFHEIWQYENKISSTYLHKIYDLPTIPTTITNNKNEALKIIDSAQYPFITKTKIGSGSRGVDLIKNKKQAKRKIKKIFGPQGKKTYFPYENQKNYFYVQQFIEDAKFDLRIIIVDDMAFGYYRYPNKGDFKASGSGRFEKKQIPLEALEIAINVKNKLKSRQLGIDLLYSETRGQYFIIETSLFNQIDTPEQLKVEGVPGYYDISDLDNITFKPGKYWIQEILLRSIVENWSSEKANS